MFLSELFDSHEQFESGISESMEDALFRQVVAKSIAKNSRWRN